MKTNKTEFPIKILFLLLLIACSNASKTSFGMLKKTMKKSNSNNNLQNNIQSQNQNKAKNNSSTPAPPQSQPAAPVDSIQKPEENGSNGVPTLPDQPIYAQGWIKYLHYDDAGKNKKKMFWKNTLFEQEQRMAQSGDKSAPQSDEFGSIRIPDELSFFAIFYKDSMNVLNTRKNGYSSVVDTLNYNYIKLIPETNIKEGGLKDYGNFKEGYCFKIETEIPQEKFVQSKENMTPEKVKYIRWIICVASEAQKKKFMDILTKLKIKNQRSKGLYVEFSKESTTSVQHSQSISISTAIKKHGVGSFYEETKDCRMIVLHDWSECTLSCGGGKSYLQLMKVMKNTGPDAEDCKTKESILTRDCNMQPCPTAGAFEKTTKQFRATEVVAANATVKMMAISSRLQRYDKCHLKEGDALMLKKDDSVKEFTNYPLVPVRVVMNDKTFTAYQDDNLENKISTYLLQESAFSRVKDKATCFIIRNNVSEDQFCMLDSSKGDFVEEWDYDFNLFKNQCKKSRTKSVTEFENKRMENEFQSKVEDLKLELVKEKSEVIKKKVSEDEKKKFVNKIDQVRKTSLRALEKEMKLEDLLEKEEESKEEEENKTLEMQIQSEKKKEDCLLKAIKEKEIENQYNIAKSQADRAIQKIAQETQQQIVMQRKNIARKIMEMRQKQKRKKAQLKSEIMTIRTQIAERLQKINKVGDSAKCMAAHERTAYCTAHFADNYIKFGECENAESFCYVCCENEFGDLHILDRDNCYNGCDNQKTNNANSSTTKQ